MGLMGFFLVKGIQADGKKGRVPEKKSQCELASGWDEMLLSSLSKKGVLGVVWLLYPQRRQFGWFKVSLYTLTPVICS